MTLAIRKFTFYLTIILLLFLSQRMTYVALPVMDASGYQLPSFINAIEFGAIPILHVFYTNPI